MKFRFDMLSCMVYVNVSCQRSSNNQYTVCVTSAIDHSMTSIDHLHKENKIPSAQDHLSLTSSQYSFNFSFSIAILGIYQVVLYNI